MTYRGARAPVSKRCINLPKAVRLVHILDAKVRTDRPTAIISVESEKGFIGTRISGSTGGVDWTVDLYGGNLYLVRVTGFASETCNTPLRVIHLLYARLPHAQLHHCPAPPVHPTPDPG